MKLLVHFYEFRTLRDRIWEAHLEGRKTQLPRFDLSQVYPDEDLVQDAIAVLVKDRHQLDADRVRIKPAMEQPAAVHSFTREIDYP